MIVLKILLILLLVFAGLLFLILFFLVSKALAGMTLYVIGGALGVLLVFIAAIIKRRRN